MPYQILKRTGLPCTMLLLGWTSSTWAATSGAETAAQLLAKAQAIDVKCHYLQSADRDELAGLVAKAEVALASQSDVATTKATMASGRALGRSAPCSGEEQAVVESVLKDARDASKSSVAMEPTAADLSAAAAPTVFLNPASPKPKPIVTPHLSVASAGTRGLETYAAMTKRYYLARRCNSMPHYSMASFYRDVVATHYKVVKSFGVRAVAAVMQHSQAVASQQSCG